MAGQRGALSANYTYDEQVVQRDRAQAFTCAASAGDELLHRTDEGERMALSS